MSTIWDTPTVIPTTVAALAAVSPQITITLPVHNLWHNLPLRLVIQNFGLKHWVVAHFIPHFMALAQEVISLRCDGYAVCCLQRYKREPFDTFRFVKSLYCVAPLTFLAPKALGFHFLWSISPSFFRDPFSQGGHSGARADGSKHGPVILSQ